MPRTTLGYMARDGGLRPVRGLEVEYDQVGEIGSVLVLATEDEQLVALV